jgi:hypothetical protein
MASRFHAIDATMIPLPRLLDGVVPDFHTEGRV